MPRAKLILSSLLILSCSALAAEELSSSLRRCKALAEAQARLACYDAILPGAPSAPPTNAPPPSGQEPHTRTSTSGDSAAVARFGLGPDEVGVPAAVNSRIPGRFEGWEPNSRIRLANGQVWVVSDGTSGSYWLDNPKVRIVRGSLGAYYLEVEGTSISVRVRRLQ